MMHSMRWGLVPHWSKAEPPTLNTINARAENLEEGGGMWGSIKGRKRCVVVAQGYVPSSSSHNLDGPFSRPQILRVAQERHASHPSLYATYRSAAHAICRPLRLGDSGR